VGRPVRGGARSARADGYLGHARRHCFAPFAVMLDGSLIGDLGLQHLQDGPEVEFLFRIVPRAWGRGLVTEAGDAALS
jgi:RimJ/RimL family protein N-acetyltransferase